MAQVSVSAVNISERKRVQELVINGDELPPRYIHKAGDYGDVDISPPFMDIPIIDLQSLLASDKQELHKLHSALNLWGCFQIINHGMTRSFLDEVKQVGKQFFELPKEEKQKYSKAMDGVEGYGNDSIFSDNQTFDWNDRLYLTVHPQDKQKLKFWPKRPQHFREVLQEYAINLQGLTEDLFKAMARSLSLEDDAFLSLYCGDGASMQARFNFYPRCPRPELVVGLKPHSDKTALTVLLQDYEVDGFQLLKDNQWFRVPLIPHALIVNVGDQLEIMSNGIFKSAVHRAVVNSEKARMSVVVFCMPDPEKDIGPLEKLIDEKRPKLYQSVKNYPIVHLQYYQNGKRAIDAIKI